MSEKENENQNEINIEKEGKDKDEKVFESPQQEEKENQQNEPNINPEIEQMHENNNEFNGNNLDNNEDKNKDDINITNDINNNHETIDLNYINADINKNNNSTIKDDETKLKIKEDYELVIKNLNQELEEKNELLIQLQNLENPEYKIPEILGKIEAQNLFEMINENKIKEQRLKIDSIKSMVKNLDEQFKYQLKMKEQKINKKLEPFVKKNKDLLQELNSCKNQMNQLKERLERSNNILTKLQKEKGDYEESIIKREEKLNILLDRLNLFEELNKKKTKILKENEIYSKELIKIIEEQKEEIRELEKNNDSNKYVITTNNNNNKNQDNERYNINTNNDVTNDINNNITQNEDNNIILPYIYNNNTEDKNKNINETEKVDYELDKKEEENNNHKLNEFKNLMDDLYNNIID
jgi:hypothetical protein